MAAQETGGLTTEPELSLARVGLDPHFLEHLYETFFMSHTSISALLSQLDCEKRKMLMLTEIVALLQFWRGEENGKLVLDLLRFNHALIGMESFMYPYWLNSLLKTLTKFDPKWSPELETIWTHSLRSGLEYISTPAMDMKGQA